jgi:hypothetical protein
MGLEYIKTGDYYIPTLMANKEPEEPLTKYGLMRKTFLKEHRRGIYTGMMLEGTLKEHCLTIQQQAEERMDVLIKQMSQEQGVDEKLKALDQMKWVRMMNIIRASAEEMVCNEIIYI